MFDEVFNIYGTALPLYARTALADYVPTERELRALKVLRGSEQRDGPGTL